VFFAGRPSHGFSNATSRLAGECDQRFFREGGGGSAFYFVMQRRHGRFAKTGSVQMDRKAGTKKDGARFFCCFLTTIMYYCRRCGSRGRLRPTPPSIKTTDQVTHSSPPSRCENASFLRRFVAAKKPEYLPRQAWDKHGKRFPREKACCVCLLLQAVCWLFGKEISLQLSPTGDVPVGLVSNNWGQKRKTPSSL
jgi:hypothetical protein